MVQNNSVPDDKHALTEENCFPPTARSEAQRHQRGAKRKDVDRTSRVMRPCMIATRHRSNIRRKSSGIPIGQRPTKMYER
eukprot:2810076-Prymnesium_polylepis.2